MVPINDVVDAILDPGLQLSPHQFAKPHGAAPAAPTAVVAPAAPAAAPAAAAVAAFATIKVYFDSGEAAPPGDLAATIAKAAEWAKATPSGKLAISGFHDSTGNVEQNAELAKNRAKMVLEALKSAGVTEDRVALQKPQQTDAGDGREARRVEVFVAPQ